MHVTYVPFFYTNVVSLSYFISKDVYWDIKGNWLTFNGETFCKVWKQHSQWILEYTKLEEQMEAYMTQLAQPQLDSEATADIWHWRLGHIHKDVVEKLSEAVTRVKLTKNSTFINCEICQISKTT